ncbi:ankyrin repeat-containing domain protein [Podospora appendiculata]|uniref:Ankyrin repeat-containing domain protein n=1 Tax=Podospora appendiculata TaxID=314037 RepID=A0AAE0X9T2_9PEZI|nr:ankyrin repeat-containing domain protein [Podospora appendiculata]
MASTCRAASISALPTELVVFVIEYLPRLKDLSSLALTDRKFYTTCNPILYRRAVSRGDAWPLAWAAHCGVPGTLRKALAAGANPNHQFVDELPFDEWKKDNAAARQAIVGHADIDSMEVWDTDNECESNVEWSPETEDSDHVGTITTNQPSSNSNSDQWGHVLNDSDRDSDVSMDELETLPSDAASSTLDDLEREHRLDMATSASGIVQRRFNPIHLAARGGHDEIVTILLDHGAWVNTFSEFMCDCTRLYGLLNATECPENDDTPPPWSPLHIALCHLRSATAKLLLFRGASHMMEISTNHHSQCPPRVIQNSATALHHAAAFGLADVVTHVLDTGIQTTVDIRDEKTLTPLFHAYANRHWDSTVPLLLERGASIDVDTKLFLPYSTITPLGEACRLGDFEEADRLIELGADVNRGYISTTSGLGLSPLHMACMLSARSASESAFQRVYEEEERGARRMRTIEKLIANGADIEARDCPGDTPIIIAAQSQNVPGIRALIKAGADIHARNTVGRNSVMQAIVGPPSPAPRPRDDNIEHLAQSFRALLDAGARLDETDTDGNTILHLVFQEGGYKFHSLQIAILRFLLNKPGARDLFNVRNKAGQIPLQIAFHERNMEACEILVRHGCLRDGISHKDLQAMLDDALATPRDQVPVDFVLDLDRNGTLTSDPSFFHNLLEKGGYASIRAAQIVSYRGLPPLTPHDRTSLLCQAIKLGELHLAYSLLEAGADVDAREDNGDCALSAFIANTYMPVGPVRSSSDYQFLQALLDRGANIHMRVSPHHHQRILHKVIELHMEEQLFLMLKKQPLADDARAAGGFYLHLALTMQAARPPNEKIIDALLASGASLTEVNEVGDTPLSILLKTLCKERHFTWRYHRFIKALHGPGVDVNRQNNEGRSVVDYLQELMYPKNGGPGQTTFLTRRIQVIDAAGGVGRALKFLPRPHKRVRPANIIGR